MEEIEGKDLSRYKKSSLVFALSLVAFGSRHIYLQHSLSSTEVSGTSTTTLRGSRLVPPRGDPVSMLSPLLRKEPLMHGLWLLPVLNPFI